MKALRAVAHFILRIVLVWLLDAGALLLLSEILPGVSVTDFGVALVVAALIGLMNALVWPLVIRFALPVAVLTLGLGSLVLNGLVILAASALDAGLKIDGLGTAIVVAFGLTLITTLVTSLLSIDDDSVWTRNVVRRQRPAQRGHRADGRARALLPRDRRSRPRRASSVRFATARLPRSPAGSATAATASSGGRRAGPPRLVPARRVCCTATTSTYPAFRWWEKDRGRPIVTNHPRDAAELEHRLSDGRGLLHEDGASRANILSGDASTHAA